MKKLFFTILTVMTFGYASAQADPQKADKPLTTQPQKDSVSTAKEVEKETDLKTMDAVKTKDHPKTTKKDNTSTKKDTVRTKGTRRN